MGSLGGLIEQLSYYSLQFGRGYALKAGKRYVIAGGPDLHVAIRRGETQSVLAMIKEGADVNHVDNRPSVGMGSPLHVAVSTNNIDIATQLLQADADPTLFDRKGRTPLHLCGDNGHVKMASLLLEAGVDANIGSENSDTTPLLIAVRNRHSPMVHELITKGANPNILDGRGSSAVHTAIGTGELEQLRIMLRSPKANPDVLDRKGQTPLMQAVLKRDINAVDMLLDFGCNINCKDRRGRTPLHHAANNLRKNIVQRLCERGAQVEIRDKKGWPPLQFLMIHNVMFGLADYKARDRLAIMDILISQGTNVNGRDNFENSPMHIAASKDIRNVLLKKLLDSGGDPTVVNIKQETPLVVAQQNNAMLNVQLLEQYVQQVEQSSQSIQQSQQQQSSGASFA